jgi:hypothetical protein
VSRSRASAKAAGSRHERVVADWLAEHVSEFIDRKVKTGALDAGDIGGVRTLDGRRVALECKDYGGQVKVGPWLQEAATERENDGAAASAVIAKRRGITDPARQIVIMELRDLAVLLGWKGEGDGQ